VIFLYLKKKARGGFFEKSFTRRMCMDWLIVFIGIVIGAVVTAYVFCRNFVGTLRVDQSDPTDAPYLFLEIEKGMGDISRKKYVLLRVNTESYILHD
jgi:hypothetical protein